MNPLFRRFHEAMRAAKRQEEAAAYARKLVKIVKGKRSGFKDLGSVRKGMRDVSRAIKSGDKLNYGRVSQFVKDMLWNEMMRVLGPLGSIVGAMIRPSNKALTENIDRELRAAQDLLEQFGYEVTAPGQRKGSGSGLSTPPASPRTAPISPQPLELETPGERIEEPATPETQRADRTGHVVKIIDGYRIRIKSDDPILTGQMIKVKSSNVHSIGYLWNDANPAQGTLQVRFLDHRKGRQAKAGAGYQYFQVHPKVFVAFTKAASKGKFVWDKLRVRGTVSGHQYRYSIATLASDGYVPRKARLAAGGYHIGAPGSHTPGHEERFMRRTVKGPNGKVYQSSLPERSAGVTRPGNGRPNRGGPNRGR